MLSCRSTRVWGGLLLLSLLVLSVGCGGDKFKARAIVKGKVTFSGKALTTGSVSFYGKDNVTGTASIDKNGNYQMNDAPRGEVKITVFVPQAPPGGPAGMKFSPGGKSAGGIMGDMPAYIVQIPEKYNSVQTSGLSFTVKGGEQTHDIELTP